MNGIYRTSLPTALLISISLIELAPSGASGQPFGAPTQFGTAPGPGDAAVGDLNGDGALDLVTAHQGSGIVSVLLGDGSGALQPHREYATGTGPFRILVRDMNQDGILDVLTLGQAAVSVLLGNGDGSFRERADFPTANPQGPSTFFAIADLNADSKLDVVVVGFGIVSVFLGNGDGTFAPRTDDDRWGVAYSVAVTDLNGDSKPDIAFSKGGGITVLFGNGDGTFGYGGYTPVYHVPSGGDPDIIAVGDLNGDGKSDLATVVFDVHILSVLLGNGDGTFGDVIDWGSPFAPGVLGKGDFNGDGRLDLSTLPDAGGVAILTGAGDGRRDAQYVYETGGAPGFIAPADLNGDLRLDLVVTLPSSNSVAVLLNVGNRAPEANARGPYAGLATQCIDFNGTASSDPNGDALAFTWDFGDGKTASGPTPAHAYPAEGVFPVMLHVADAGGLSNDDSTTATVRSDVPVAVLLKNNGTVLDVSTGRGSTKVAIEETMMPYSSIHATTLRLKTDYPTPGAVTECAADTRVGTGTIGDMDLNGVPDYQISFATSCVRDLLSGAPNNSTVNIIVAGEVQTTSGTAPLRGVKSVTLRTGGPGSAPIMTSASPNPFNPETAISYTVKSEGPVTLRVYSMDGRLVRTLKQGEMTAAGTHEVRWDGANDQNQQASSGIYFVRTDQVLAGGAQSAVLKVTLTK
jgi:PKD domain-containing protein/VCBS repeat protein/flagellar hook capping protein FlgD